MKYQVTSRSTLLAVGDVVARQEITDKRALEQVRLVLREPARQDGRGDGDIVLWLPPAADAHVVAPS